MLRERTRRRLTGGEAMTRHKPVKLKRDEGHWLVVGDGWSRKATDVEIELWKRLKRAECVERSDS